MQVYCRQHNAQLGIKYIKHLSNLVKQAAYISDTQHKTYRFVDVEKGDRGRIVFNKTHLGADSHHTRNSEVEQTSGRLLLLAQEVVQHAQKLQHTFLPPGLSQAGIVHHEVWIHLDESSGEE